MANGVDNPTLIYAPRAAQDLEKTENKFAHQVLDDLEMLGAGKCPAGKIKKLHGIDFMELKTGDHRTIYRKTGSLIVVVRVANRRELDRAVGSIDPISFRYWLKSRISGR